MAYFIQHRLFSCTSITRYAVVSAHKSLLAQLRKSTGYSLSHCKKALQQHDNDVDKASAWLSAQAQAEGWAKAGKLAGRSTQQGLLGVAVNSASTSAAIVEVNCETDFVARNALFVKLATELTESCLASNSTITSTDTDSSTLRKELWSNEQLSAMPHKEGKTLADEVALTIGLCGENMSLARALKLSSSGDSLLYGYTHPAPTDGVVVGNGGGSVPIIGKFATIVAVKSLNKQQMPDLDVLKQLCLQIIGMNPESIGTPEEIQKYDQDLKASMASAVKKTTNTKKDTIKDEGLKDEGLKDEGLKDEGLKDESLDDESPVDEESVKITMTDKEPKDKFLMLQDWMADEEYTVSEVLQEAGLEVVDFVRLRVGDEGDEGN